MVQVNIGCRWKLIRHTAHCLFINELYIEVNRTHISLFLSSGNSDMTELFHNFIAAFFLGLLLF